MYSKEFKTRKEATIYVKEFEKNGINIAYRITANYPLVLVGNLKKTVKADRTQKPTSYTLMWC